jgi:mevalonate kinase
MRISATAPTKVILCGEHFVVYGAPAIAFHTSVPNEVILRERKGEGFEIESAGKIARALPDGRAEGDMMLRNFLQLYWTLVEGSRRTPGKKLHATFVSHGAFKGMGNSASLAAALARALLRYSKRKMKPEELFNLVQENEMRMHGGRASGIDARTVIAGRPQVFMKQFNPVRHDFRDAELCLPKGAVLLAVDTYAGSRESTSGMTAKFAKEHGIAKAPEGLDDAERKALSLEYVKIFGAILRELTAEGDAKKLGRLMDENERLLRSVESTGIKAAISAARKAGALGAKLTGAGGEGGAVIALAGKKDAAKIIKAEKKLGFRAFRVL